MVGFAELKDADFRALRDQLADWTAHARRLKGLETAFRGGVNDVTEQAGWQGVSAGVADIQLELVVKRIALASLQAQAVASALRTAPDEFEAARLRLRTLLDEAAAQQLTVAPLGCGGFDVRDAQELPDPDPAAVKARRDLLDSLLARIQGVLRQAADVDSRVASVLATFMPADVASTDADAWGNAAADLQRAAGLHGVGPVPPDMTPEQARTWWFGLTDAQRAEYVQAYPRLIGSTDGIPAAARDQANRTALDLRLAELDVLAAGPRLHAGYDAELRNLTRIRAVLDANAARPPEQALMLLKFGNSHLDGQVVMAVGNPDTAKHTVVHVPGVATTVTDSLDAQIARATRLQAASDRLTPGQAGDVAAVFWMDYDPPEFDWRKAQVTGVLDWDRSQEGAPRLDAFVDGLRTVSPNQHITLSGHSYGSTVIGEAAKHGDGSAADDIVVMGSPGMHVNRATDLQIDPDHVWALRADGDDYIPGVGKMAHGVDEPQGSLRVQEPTLPTDPDFGGQVMVANSGDHSSYWDLDGGLPDDSLENTTRVVMGTYDDPDPNKRPATK